MEKFKGIIPENLAEMKWHPKNAKLSLFGISVTDFVGYVAWELDTKWKWSISNTRFQGREATRELAQKALCQIFEDAKNIPEIKKEKPIAKSKDVGKNQKNDGHGKTD